MTAEEIVVAALARGAEFGAEFPSTRSVYYRRIAQRDRELQTMLGAWNPALVSTDEVVDVDDGMIDLSALAASPSELRAVLIEDSGTSDYDAADQVNIVPPDDASGHLPPRAYFRGASLLVGIANDLAGVASVRVFAAGGGVDDLTADDEPATPAAHQELLVIDLARFMATVVTTVPNGNSATLLAVLNGEEASRLSAFERFALNFTSASTSRFGSDVRPTSRPAQ